MLYFPHSDFLQVGKCPKVSWCWSNLLEGREAMKNGLMWRIGDGSKVRIWEDKCVPTLKANDEVTT